MASFHLSVKVGKRGAGGAHADYIQRIGSYKNYRNGEDLVHTESVNMPTWAEHDSSEFFRMADLHERANGSAYREYEIALPRELTQEQRIKLVREFVTQEIGTRHPCAWAIHNPPAALEGDDQPHAHIMFSDRRLDGIERGPEAFFKRANTKQPEKGGCAKANVPATQAERKEALVALRSRWADLQNQHLAVDAHPVRVTHLSLKDQGLARQPEKHLGPVNARDAKQTKPILQHRDANERLQAAEEEVNQIDITSSLAAALKERAENERIRAAAIGRISANLRSAGIRFEDAGRAFAADRTADRSHQRLDRRLERASENQHARRAGEIAHTAGAVIARLIPEIDVVTARLVQIVLEQERKRKKVLDQVAATLASASRRFEAIPLQCELIQLDTGKEHSRLALETGHMLAQAVPFIQKMVARIDARQEEQKLDRPTPPIPVFHNGIWTTGEKLSQARLEALAEQAAPVQPALVKGFIRAAADMGKFLRSIGLVLGE